MQKRMIAMGVTLTDNQLSPHEEISWAS